MTKGFDTIHSLELRLYFAVSDALFGSCPLGQAIEYGSVLPSAGFEMPDVRLLQDAHWKLTRASRDHMPTVYAEDGSATAPDAHTVLQAYYGWPGELVEGWQIKTMLVEVESAEDTLRQAKVERRRAEDALTELENQGADHDRLVTARRAVRQATEAVTDAESAKNRKREAAADRMGARLHGDPYRIVSVFPLTTAAPDKTRRHPGESAQNCLHRLWREAEAVPGDARRQARALLRQAQTAYRRAHAAWLLATPTKRAQRTAAKIDDIELYLKRMQEVLAGGGQADHADGSG